MKTQLLAALLAALIPAAPAAAQGAAEPDGTSDVPLYENLGTHGYPVTTGAELAQRYFDQGLRLFYAFNHSEAVRAFSEGERIDSACAMCAWGTALALGPNINAGMDAVAATVAYAAVRRAMARSELVSARERALIRPRAEPARPANSRPVTTGPSSRSRTSASPSPTASSAPKRASCV